MKVYAIRGVTIAQLELPTPRQCIHIEPIHLIPKEILSHADFVFEVQKDKTVLFYKKRSSGKNKNFFNLSLALKHIERHYSNGLLNIVPESFEIWDLTEVSSIEEKMNKIESYVKQLREGVK